MKHIVYLAAVLSGCVRADVVTCGDSICPPTATCLAEEARCVDPDVLDVNTTALSFDVSCGSLSTEVITLRNHSTEDISFSARSTQQSIQPMVSDGVVGPGESFELAVVADPGSVSIPGIEVDGVLTIASDRGSSAIDVDMISSGAIATVSGALDFGETGLNTAKQRVVRIRNDGNATLAARFSDPPTYVTNIVDIMQTVPPGAEVSFPFQFQSPAVGDFSGRATLTLDGQLCQPAPADLEVRAIASGAALLVDSTAVELDDANCTSPAATATLGLTNNLVTPQTVSIALSESSLFSVPSSVTIAALSTANVTISRRATMATDTPGDHEATLTLTGAITKTLPVRQRIAAPMLHSSPSTLSLTGFHPVASTVITNTGNAPTQVSLEQKQSRFIRVSPTTFQVLAGGSVTLTLTGDPANETVVDTLVTTGRAAGACGEPLKVTATYDPQAK